ncbi:hypothetical protein [Candidatus Poriferisodalis sp.]|uniref:hypothetical protein n=1 Tax=Candidatus Poriferisodalis sp. TaxID=3101277 RepID=UPI003D0FB505
MSEKDGQRDLLAAICARFHAGEGVAGRCFRMTNTYLFVGDYKYWLMTDFRKIDPHADEDAATDALAFILNKSEACRAATSSTWPPTGQRCCSS